MTSQGEQWEKSSREDYIKKREKLLRDCRERVGMEKSMEQARKSGPFSAFLHYVLLIYKLTPDISQDQLTHFKTIVFVHKKGSIALHVLIETCQLTLSNTMHFPSVHKDIFCCKES